MDLVADMLMSHLGRNGVPVSPVLVRPVFPMRLQSGTGAAADRTPLTIERIAHRFWDYPRWLRRQPAADVYHIVDHSYAHLANELPDGRVVTTCHDADAFRTLLFPDRRESSLPRFLVKRVLDGLQRATVVVCDSHATRADLVDHQLIPADRTMVVPLGIHPSCSAAPDDEADRAAAKLTGPAGSRTPACRQHHRAQAHRSASRRPVAGGRDASRGAAVARRWRLYSRTGRTRSRPGSGQPDPCAALRDSTGARGTVSACGTGGAALGPRRLRVAGRGSVGMWNTDSRLGSSSAPRNRRQGSGVLPRRGRADVGGPGGGAARRARIGRDGMGGTAPGRPGACSSFLLGPICRGDGARVFEAGCRRGRGWS